MAVLDSQPTSTERDKGATATSGDRLSLVSIAKEILGYGASTGKDKAPTTAPLVAGVTAEQSVSAGADARNYAVHFPKNWDGKSPLPVLYYFNGMQTNGKPEAESFTGLSDRSDKMGFAVVYMRGSNDRTQTYNNGQKIFANSKDENAYLNSVRQALGKQVPLDQNRQGLVGFSEGGSEAYSLAATNKWVSSVQTVEGYMTGYEQPINHPVSEQNIHALHDPIIPENGTAQVCSEADREGQAVLDSMRWGGDGYIDPVGMLHDATCEIEKNGNYIEPQRYTVAAYKNADGITSDAPVVTTPDMTIYDSLNAKTGAEVRQITLAQGTHGWAGSTDHSGDLPIVGIPNEKLSASDEIGNFFLDHPLIKE
jgi:poly(3-hydroxybutyrate) depolymerase